VNPIRPAGYPVQTPANPAAEQARLAAQRAFFDQALGRAGAPARPAAATAPQAPSASTPAAQPAPVRTATSEPEAAAAKPLRPGSLLDIRV
jgi:hypothetical protein